MLMAPELNEELSALVAEGRAEHIASQLDLAELLRADYVFIATGDEALDDQIAAAAHEGGALVNMIDRPEACDMITPSIVDRDPLVVAIGTEGTAPVLGRSVKTMLEAALSPRLGPFAAMLGAMRPEIAKGVAPAARLSFWKWAVSGAPWRRWLAGDEAGARDELSAAIEAGGAPASNAARITMIALPEAPDLLPLRAVERLQGAVMIYHPGDADPAILDYARRDAERRTLSACPRDALSFSADDGPVVVLTRAACRPGGADYEFIPALGETP